MTDRSRVAITLSTALAFGACTYGRAFDISPPGVLYNIWYGSAFGWILFGLAVFGVSLVYRWWALLPAIAPAAVMIYLHNMTEYVSPWHDDLYDGLSDHPLFVLFVIGGIIMGAAVLSAGLLLRAVWEWVGSGRRGGSLADSV